MNGEWRDREKVMRDLKKGDSPVLAGMQICHNFIRPHMGLGGKTLAEAAGIKVEGENKWLTLIQNASRKAPQPKSEGRSPAQSELRSMLCKVTVQREEKPETEYAFYWKNEMEDRPLVAVELAWRKVDSLVAAEEEVKKVPKSGFVVVRVEEVLD